MKHGILHVAVYVSNEILFPGHRAGASLKQHLLVVLRDLLGVLSSPATEPGPH